MIMLLKFVSPSAMQSLGWALLHFLWQGTALAALAAVAMAFCRRASTRYLVGMGALVLMMLAPVATVSFYAHQHSVAVVERQAAHFVASASAVSKGSPAAGGMHRTSSATSWMNVFPWLVEAWLFGVAFFSLRSAGGFLLLERDRRRQSTVVETRVLEICLALQERFGIDRAIAYCECKWLQAPAVIGWFRPVVFLPLTALTGLSEEQLETVIAHELAHIQRFDPFVNLIQVCAETLLFYHPAIWWLNKKIRAEREHCCDDMAVAVCGNAVEYARALTLMEEWRSAPAFAMAANHGPLAERIVRLLGLKNLTAGMRGVGFTSSVLCLSAALVAGHTLLGMASPRQIQANSPARPQTTSSSQPEANSTPSSKPSPARAQSSARTEGSASASASATSYIDGMKAAGLGDLTVDELIALKIQDVTPEFVRGMHEQGLHPDANHLVAMRVQGVTPEYVHSLRESGLDANENQIIALKVQGADGDYYRELKQAGIQPDVDTLIGLKVQGVTPEYVRELRAAGLSVTADQVIALKVQDVSAAYLKGLHEQGIDPRADDAIAMRVQDVTPEYVRDLKALGLKPTANELIAMRVQDVTPEYVKALQAAGYKFSIGDIISAKVQDVTPEFIERAQKHGFKDLTLQKLIQLRQLGILDSKADL